MTATRLSRSRPKPWPALARTYFLFGTVAHTPAGAPLNSAVLLGPGGDYVDRYDKIHLVPFGEVRAAAVRVGQPDHAGDRRFRARQPPGGLSRRGARTSARSSATKPCLPHFVRRFAAGGAEVFVNMSNDGYFGRSAAREQHLQIVRMRAVENRRWILRSTNDGMTAAIDPAGRILTRVPPFEEVAQRAAYSYLSAQTTYTRYGDWFPLLCTVVGLAALLLSHRKCRSMGIQ